MKKLLILWILISGTGLSFISAGQSADIRTSLQDHVYTLASESMMGRRAGSEESAAAAAYILNNFEEIGLYPAALTDNGGRSYLQRFEKGGDEYANVLGFLPGNDPELREEYIVLGAHYDHLGYTVGRGDTTVYHGADDNASGVAVLIEVARQLKAREKEIKRSVIFAAFDAEEIGLYGSTAMAGNMALEKVKFMASIDMVGWLREAGSLQIKGIAELVDGKETVESIYRPDGLNIKAVKNGRGVLTGSDHDSFRNLGIPAMLITTGTLSPYHTPRDSAEQIDFEGMELITEYVTALAAELATREEVEPATSKNRLRSGTVPVEFAVTASIGSSGLNFYPKGAVRGIPAFSWNAGLFLQYNFNEEVALRTEINYSHRTFRFPLSTSEGDLLATGGYRKLVSPALTVPATLLVKFHSTSDFYFYAGAGLYYSYVFDARLEGNTTAYYRNQGGISLTVGWNMKHFGIAYMGYLPFMYMAPSRPRIWGYSNYWTIYYKF